MSKPEDISPLMRAIVMLVVVALIAGSGYALYRLVTEAPPDGPLWILVLGGVGWVIKSSVEQKRELRKQLAAEKQKHYLAFLNVVLSAIVDSENMDVAKFREWSLQLLLVASDDVVRSWNRARAIGETDGQEQEDKFRALLAFGDVFLAMRKDAGLPDSKLTSAETLALLVKSEDLALLIASKN